MSEEGGEGNSPNSFSSFEPGVNRAFWWNSNELQLPPFFPRVSSGTSRVRKAGGHSWTKKCTGIWKHTELRCKQSRLNLSFLFACVRAKNFQIWYRIAEPWSMLSNERDSVAFQEEFEVDESTYPHDSYHVYFTVCRSFSRLCAPFHRVSQFGTNVNSLCTV